MYIRAVAGNTCFGGGSVNLITQPFIQIEDKEVVVCPQHFPVSINSGISTKYISNYNYSWNTGETTNTINVNTPGVYELIVTDPIYGCSKSINVTVSEVEAPIIKDIKIDDNDIEVFLSSSNGDVEYSIDDNFSGYQDSNSFMDLTSGDHTLYVRDKYNCTTVSQKLSIIGFPKFFTPNGDFTNDSWNVNGLNSSLISSNILISIYDRYGKLIYVFDPLKSNGWDGKYNGKPLPPDDYWYHLKLPNSKEYKGHFSLKL